MGNELKNSSPAPVNTRTTTQGETLDGILVRKWLLDLVLPPSGKYIYSYFLTHSVPLIKGTADDFDKSNYCSYSINAIAKKTIFAKTTLSSNIKTLLGLGLLVGYADASGVTRYRAVIEPDQKPVYLPQTLFSKGLDLKATDFNIYISIAGLLGNTANAKIVNVQNFSKSVSSTRKTIGTCLKKLADKRMLSLSLVKTADTKRNVGSRISLISPTKWLIDISKEPQTTKDKVKYLEVEYKPKEATEKEATVSDLEATAQAKTIHELKRRTVNPDAIASIKDGISVPSIVGQVISTVCAIEEIDLSGWLAFVPAYQWTLYQFVEDLLVKRKTTSIDFKSCSDNYILASIYEDLIAAADSNNEDARRLVNNLLNSFIQDNMYTDDYRFPVDCSPVQVVLKTKFPNLQDRINYLKDRGYSQEDINNFRPYLEDLSNCTC